MNDQPNWRAYGHGLLALAIALLLVLWAVLAPDRDDATETPAGADAVQVESVPVAAGRSRQCRELGTTYTCMEIP